MIALALTSVYTNAIYLANVLESLYLSATDIHWIYKSQNDSTSNMIWISFSSFIKGFFNEWIYSIQSMNVLQLNKILKIFGGGGYFAWPHTSSANRLNKWLLSRRQLFPLSWIHFLSSRSRKLKVDELLSNW